MDSSMGNLLHHTDLDNHNMDSHIQVLQVHIHPTDLPLLVHRTLFTVDPLHHHHHRVAITALLLRTSCHNHLPSMPRVHRAVYRKVTVRMWWPPIHHHHRKGRTIHRTLRRRHARNPPKAGKSRETFGRYDDLNIPHKACIHFIVFMPWGMIQTIPQRNMAIYGDLCRAGANTSNPGNLSYGHLDHTHSIIEFLVLRSIHVAWHSHRLEGTRKALVAA